VTLADRAQPDYQALFESAPVSCAVLDPELVFVAASDAYLSDTMTVREQIIGRGIFEVFPGNPDDFDETGTGNLHASLERVCHDLVPDTMAVQRYDIPRPEAAGGGFEIRYWSTACSPGTSPDGRLTSIFIVVQDVTEYVRLNEREARHIELTALLQERTQRMEADIVSRSQELQEANRVLRAADAAKNEFLSRVSHELRTPLNAMLGYGELLSLADVTAEHHEWATTIVRSGRTLRCLLDEMLDIFQLETRHLTLSVEPVPVHRAIADALDAVRPLAASSGIHLEPEPAAQAGRHVLADYQRLRQVLLNLLSNAVKYNRPDGTVTVTVEPRPGGRLRINVTDTGQGMSLPSLAKLFTPFERLDAAQAGIEGTGLGLVICRELVQAMHGETGATSIEGRGSTFWAELPETRPATVAEVAAESPPAGAAGSPPASRHAGQHDDVAATRAYATTRTVLYVEDVAENLWLVERVLKRRPSVTLLAAASGAAGLDLAREHHPDLILLDVHLPDMKGDEVICGLRASLATSTIPVVALSADATKYQIDRVMTAGAVAYLTKPIDLRQFLQTVDDVIGQPQPAI
jgi:signal transduction histidine kinase/ActR/RegA family two-component response regulator